MKLAIAGLEVAALLLGVTGVGLAGLRRLGGTLSRAEAIAGGFACGLMIQGLLVVLSFALSLRPSLALLVATNAAVALAFALPRMSADNDLRRRKTASAQLSIQARLLIAAAALGSARFFLEAIAEPMWATDFLAIWGLKGHTIFAVGAIPGYLFHDRALEWAHPEYPLLVPLVLAALSFAIGSWNDQALAVLYPACQIATLLAVFGFIQRRASSSGRSAAASVALVAWCVGLYTAGNVGTAEIPLALALVLLAQAFLDLLEEDSPAVRFRLAAFSLFACAVKQEGMLFSLLVGVALAGRALRGKGVTASAVSAPLVPPIAHLAMLRLFRGPVLNRDFDWTLANPSRWPELLHRLTEVATRVASVELPAAALAIAALALALLATRRSFADALLGPLAIQVLVYAAVCAFSAFSPTWAVASAFARITLTLFPVLALVLGARLSVGESE